MMTFEEVAAFLQADREGPVSDYTAVLEEVRSPETAAGGHVVFAQDMASLMTALESRAGAILANATLRAALGEDANGTTDLRRVLWVKHPRLAFARVAQRLLPECGQSEISSSAMISAGARVGERVWIGPGVVIEDDVVIGDGCRLEARVVVHAGSVLGAKVTVKAGAVLGSTGFGFVRDPESGEYVPFPQRGRLVIEDEVWIGANSTIDRGALGETRIRRGTKIDNLVHIAHNCTIGRDVVIAAQTGIAGSSTVGDGAVIAGQAGIADHVTIGEGVIVGAKAGVPSNKNLQGAGQVFWGIPARPIQQYLRELARLKRLTGK